MDLLKGAHKRITVTEAALQVFEQLKTLFSSAPVLKAPDPDKPFWVEVDASEVGLGAVLSQTHGGKADYTLAPFL